LRQSCWPPFVRLSETRRLAWTLLRKSVMAARRNGSLFLGSQITCLMTAITRLMTEVYGDGVCVAEWWNLMKETALIHDPQNCGERLLTSSCLSVCVSVRLLMRVSVHVEQLGSHWMDFHEIWYLSIFSKIYWENSRFITIQQEERLLYMNTNVHLWSYLIKGQVEVTRRRGRRRKKLLGDLKDRREYCQLKEEALDRTVWRNRFGRGFRPVVWQITDEDDDDDHISLTSS